MFSRDVTAATSVPLHKGTEAMLVPQINTPGIELYSYENVFLFWLKSMFIDHMSENTLYAET